MPVEVKIMISALLSGLAVSLYAARGGECRRKCMAAMLLCTAGDFFMVDILSLGMVGTYIGAGFFIAAHIVYTGAFAGNCRRHGYRFFGTGFFTGLSVMVLSAAALLVQYFLAAVKKPVMLLLILLYIAVIGCHLCSEYAYAFARRGFALVLPFAVTLFYITDIFIFLHMLGLHMGLRQYVWYFYPFAQLGIILFNSEGKKETASV